MDTTGLISSLRFCRAFMLEYSLDSTDIQVLDRSSIYMLSFEAHTYASCDWNLYIINYFLFLLAACSSCLVPRSCPRFNRSFSRSLKHFNLMWNFVFNALVVFRIWSFHFQASSCFQDKLVPFCQRLHTRSKNSSLNLFLATIFACTNLYFTWQNGAHIKTYTTIFTHIKTRGREEGADEQERERKIGSQDQKERAR